MSARESSVAAAPEERLIQAVWAGQLAAADRFATANGLPVEVLDPGRWNNSGRGPDFMGAQLIIDGKQRAGDVEIHVLSSDWERHGHHEDFEYNSVILHVYLTEGENRTADQLQNGGTTHRLCLAAAMLPDVEAVLRQARELLLADPGPTETARPACSRAVEALGESGLRTLLNSAARERMQAKVRRITAQAQGLGPDQVLHQAILTALGHGPSKTLYFLLSKRCPLGDLRLATKHLAPTERWLAVEAALLGTANLLPLETPLGNTAPLPGLEDHSDDSDAADSAPESDATLEHHISQLRQAWASMDVWFADRVLPPTRRWFTGVRPPNFPTRRLAGYARMLISTGFIADWCGELLRQVRAAATLAPKTRTDWKKCTEFLAEPFHTADHPVWATRSTWTSKRSARPAALLGTGQAHSLLYNAILPFSMWRAEQEGDEALIAFLWSLHENFPALADHSVARLMESRLFGPAGPPAVVAPRLERYQQGLLQVFADCCDHPAFHGAQCGLLPNVSAT